MGDRAPVAGPATAATTQHGCRLRRREHGASRSSKQLGRPVLRGEGKVGRAGAWREQSGDACARARRGREHERAHVSRLRVRGSADPYCSRPASLDGGRAGGGADVRSDDRSLVTCRAPSSDPHERCGRGTASGIQILTGATSTPWNSLQGNDWLDYRHYRANSFVRKSGAEARMCGRRRRADGA